MTLRIETLFVTSPTTTSHDSEVYGKKANTTFSSEVDSLTRFDKVLERWESLLHSETDPLQANDVRQNSIAHYRPSQNSTSFILQCLKKERIREKTITHPKLYACIFEIAVNRG
jgi:hypothetical protein